MKHCERCMKTIWIWQKKDSESIDNKITYYHWNLGIQKLNGEKRNEF